MTNKYKIHSRFALIPLFFIAFLILFFSFSINDVIAVTNISSSDRWAWNDVRGWLDFYSPGTANLTATNMTGYGVFQDTADDWISLDCATSPSGDICGTQSNYSVIHDGAGNLSGWAWNDGIGWISFCGGGDTDPNCPGTVSYQVTVNSSTGDFSGWAWNDLIGWISFCGGGDTDPNCPGTISYQVTTTHFGVSLSVIGNIISNTYDTGVVGGAAFNSVIWQGTLSAGGAVQFQLAVSNCSNGATNAPTCSTGGWGVGSSGDGAYLGPGGSSVSTDVYTGSPNQSILFTPLWHNNRRYYRYKMYIGKADGPTAPIVQDVIINWSP